MNSSLRPVVIDDNDDNIQYVGKGWFKDEGSQDASGNFGPTYLHSEHGTNENGSFAFTFNGTSITVLGTTALRQVPITNGTGNGTTFDPKWECFIDNISIGSTQPFPFAENNWALCEKSNLLDARHVLTVNVTSTGTTFWLDQLRYAPSQGMVLPNGTNVVMVTNMDPEIKYGEGWTSLGKIANCTTKPNSVLQFNFTGTSLSWLGFVPTELSHNPADATYSVDNGPPVRFRLNGLPPDPKASTIYNQVFFSTPELPQDNHSIVVTYLGNGSVTPLVLTQMYITSTTGAPSTKHSTSGISSAVIGGIVAAIISVFVAIALISLFFYRRKKQREAKLRIEDPVSAGEISPFMTTFLPTELTMSQPSLPPSTPTIGGKRIDPALMFPPSLSSSQNSRLIDQAEVVAGSALLGTRGEVAVFPSEQGGTNESILLPNIRRKRGGNENPSALSRDGAQEDPQTVLRQHEDSGLRLPAEVDVPPIYTYS